MKIGFGSQIFAKLKISSRKALLMTYSFRKNSNFSFIDQSMKVKFRTSRIIDSDLGFDIPAFLLQLMTYSLYLLLSEYVLLFWN
mgnify:CR=1 FL=1